MVRRTGRAKRKRGSGENEFLPVLTARRRRAYKKRFRPLLPPAGRRAGRKRDRLELFILEIISSKV